MPVFPPFWFERSADLPPPPQPAANITDAIVEAGVARIRPIFMTTITTVLGLTPMLIASGEGAEMRRPMALTLIAGLSFSTLLTLFIIPMAYYLFGRKKSL